MGKLSLSILLLMVAPVFAQLDPHTLTIAATRSINLQPDQVVFGLSVSSNAVPTLDQVVAALSGLGITSANLTGVSNNYAPPSFQWNFTLAVPLSSLMATIGSLTKLQTTIAQNNSGLTLTFYVDGTEISQQLQQSQSCSNSDLIADATAQGQKLAAAAGLTLGPILKLSRTPLPQPTLVAESILVGYIVPNNYRLGDFSPGFVSPAVTCSLFVEFRLLP
jgi:hypothetical protein